MALSTYGGLKSAIADYAARSDFTTVIPDFVTLAETMFNHGDIPNEVYPLRVREMETQADLTMTNGSASLPSDFLEVKRVLAATSPERILEYASPDWLAEAYPSGQDASAPRFFTIIGTTIKSVSDVELTYYAKVTTLVGHADGDNATNWLLAKSPNCYLFGALYQLKIYEQNAAAAAGYLTLLRNALSGVQGGDIYSRTGIMQRRAAMPAW